MWLTPPPRTVPEPGNPDEDNPTTSAEVGLTISSGANLVWG